MGLIQKFQLGADKVGDWFANMGDSFKGFVDSAKGYVGSFFEVVGNGSTFIGINFGSVGSIRSSIRQYVRNIQIELDKINKDVSNSNALKGEVAKATSAYIQAVTEVADAYVSVLLQYSDKMQQYADAFKKNDSTLSSDLRNDANQLKSGAKKYTEKY